MFLRVWHKTCLESQSVSFSHQTWFHRFLINSWCGFIDVAKVVERSVICFCQRKCFSLKNWKFLRFFLSKLFGFSSLSIRQLHCTRKTAFVHIRIVGFLALEYNLPWSDDILLESRGRMWLYFFCLNTGWQILLSINHDFLWTIFRDRSTILQSFYSWLWGQLLRIGLGSYVLGSWHLCHRMPQHNFVSSAIYYL